MTGTPIPGPLRWFDSHCHLQEQYLQEDRSEGDLDGGGGGLRAAMAASSAAGVDRMVCVGTNATTSGQALSVAAAAAAGEFGRGAPRVWATVGLHPHEASAGTGEVVELIERALGGGGPAPVAVGECGLDYHYEHSPRAAQRTAFAEQIALAHQHGLALVIHARDAWDDLFDVLAAEGVPSRTVLHCFTGGPDEASRCLDAGLVLSFSGIVTFKNAADVRRAVTRCPIERLLVETDSPFLAPVPHRGRPNRPALVPLVGAAVAELKGLAIAEVAERSAEVAAAVFAIEEPADEPLE